LENNMNLIFEDSYELSELSKVAEKIAKELKKQKQFCLWLEGDLGAGKTTMTRAVLQSLGLSSKIPVQSPTFMYVLEYKISDQRYFHFDLYRSQDGDFTDLVGLDLSQEDVAGLMIEWPEKDSAKSLPAPTHRLKIVEINQADRRRIRLEQV